MKQLKCYIDTNVLVYYFIDSSIYNKKAQDILLKLYSKKIIPCISTLVLDELLYSIIKLSSEKSSDLSQTNNLDNSSLTMEVSNTKKSNLESVLDVVLKMPNIEILSIPTDKQNQLKILEYINNYNLKPRDAYHLLTVKYNRINYFSTFDSDFNNVFKVERLKDFNKIIKD